MASYEGAEFYEKFLTKIPSYFTGKAWNSIERIVHLTASILAILIPIIIWKFSLSADDILALIAIITLGCLASIFALLFIIEEYRLSSKARYAEAMSSLHMCIHIIRDIHYNLNKHNISDNDRFNDLSLSLWALARCFSLTKAVNCRVCIKNIGIDEGVLKAKNLHSLTDEERLKYMYVETLCRDMETHRTGAFKDDGDYKHHTIGGNTDFRKIFLMDYDAKRYWYSNDIRALGHHYQNTRLTEAKNYKDLDYRSALVLPIRKTTSGIQHEKQKAHNQDIIGFLCIDSKTRGIFDYRYDPELAAVVADALFILMQDWFKILPKTISREKKEIYEKV